VEFEKTPQAIPFRLGAYADFAIWNPTNRKFEDIPPAERPLVAVERPPFGKGKWTHVVFTFERFNTGQSNGIVRLYLDGQPAGQLSARQQTFTWIPENATIAMGLSYIGLFDELSVFDRALSDAEVASLHALPQGVTAMIR
jgi:concanavalin A-like lectin/glucanase superfamily protein